MPEPAARRPGLTMWVYEIDGKLRELRYLVPGQTPNVSKYIDTVDLKTDDDFGAKDHFIAEVNGYLNVEQAGEYAFQLFSDDGSRMSIDGREVIDNDGFNTGKE